jgi:hypothetical protein
MRHTIPLDLIELEEGNYHLAVKAVFDNGEEVTWVIDTGASKTVFDQTLQDKYDPVPLEEGMDVRSAGIGAGQLETSLGRIHGFSLEDFHVPHLNVALIDLSHLNDLYFHATARKICGLIGSDFLLKYKAVIDYPGLKLTLRIRKSKARTRNA